MAERKRERTLKKERRDEMIKQTREEKERVRLREKVIKDAEKEGLIGVSGKCGKCKIKVAVGDIMVCAMCNKSYQTNCSNCDVFLCKGCLMK